MTLTQGSAKPPPWAKLSYPFGAGASSQWKDRSLLLNQSLYHRLGNSRISGGFCDRSLTVLFLVPADLTRLRIQLLRVDPGASVRSNLINRFALRIPSEIQTARRASFNYE